MLFRSRSRKVLVTPAPIPREAPVTIAVPGLDILALLLIALRPPVRNDTDASRWKSAHGAPVAFQRDSVLSAETQSRFRAAGASEWFFDCPNKLLDSQGRRRERKTGAWSSTSCEQVHVFDLPAPWTIADRTGTAQGDKLRGHDTP